jgi:hypothetical protein
MDSDDDGRGPEQTSIPARLDGLLLTLTYRQS